MQLVILCAGKGTRMGTDIPKVLLKIGDTTILDYIVEQWRCVVDEMVFVVGHKKEAIIPQLPKGAKIIIQEEQLGIAHAILQVEPSIKDRFIVMLGDCIYKGEFQPIPGDTKLGIGVWLSGSSQETTKNYLVKVRGNKVERVIEKPLEGILNGLCGMGVYFFDKVVFDYIRTYPYLDITDILQKMIDMGEEITPVYFEGRYVNVTTPKDLRTAEGIVSD